MMKTKNKFFAILILAAFSLVSCKTQQINVREANLNLPKKYTFAKDSLNTGKISWKAYFNDPHLISLIDSALQNNQELNIVMQEIAMLKNEIRAKKGEYLPSVGLKIGSGMEKVGEYTNAGAFERSSTLKPGLKRNEIVPDFIIGAYALWEADIWGKLHKAKKAAVTRYLSSIEGKNFMITQLVSEVADSYYELVALDNQMRIIDKNIELQSKALEIIQLQKAAAKSNALAVNRFQAQVLHTKELRFAIAQKIIETENRLNFLVGRYPQKIVRTTAAIKDLTVLDSKTGFPSDLLENRPDIKKATLDIEASKLDVQVAKAQFYPSLGISASVGYNAFNPKYLFNPVSILYSLAGELITPLINRNAIKATYYNANAKQLQAVINYERTVLQAYIEVVNNLNKVKNSEQSYFIKSQEVAALDTSIEVSNDLFNAARADYMEVLMTQRDALEAKVELVETKLNQLKASVSVYKALGGGWN